MEEISIEPARNGELTASIGKIRIHSAFNPGKEARKFLEVRLNAIQRNTSVIIIGAGLGYLDKHLAEQRRNLQIIAIHLNDDLYKARIEASESSRSVHRWYPGSGKGIETFLFEILEEASIGGLQILEWPAAVKAAPDMAEKAGKAISTLVRRYTGNISTTAAFGRIWIKNSLRNYIELNSYIIPEKTSAPIVLAASGPGLEKTLNLLNKFRERFRLWALPSSLPALTRADLKPDLIVTTDPGYWAGLHYRYFPEGIPLAMPLSAAPLFKSSPVLLLRQNIAGEDVLPSIDVPPHIMIPAMGTVAASAIELWKRISTGPLIITGLDLCWKDLRSHARPHAFDSWIAAKAERTNPLNHIRWDRARILAPEEKDGYRTGPAMRTYADWFRGNTPPGEVFRLTPVKSEKSPIVIKGFPDRGPEILESLAALDSSGKPGTIVSPENPQQRLKRVKLLISSWKQALKSGEAEGNPAIRDLRYTLDPGGILELERSSRKEYPEVMIRHMKRIEERIKHLESIYG